MVAVLTVIRATRGKRGRRCVQRGDELLQGRLRREIPLYQPSRFGVGLIDSLALLTHVVIEVLDIAIEDVLLFPLVFYCKSLPANDFDDVSLGVGA